MNRKSFLSHFLGALGAEDILWVEENDEYIKGTVVYPPETSIPYYDPIEDGQQDFCWHATEGDTPDSDICKLIELIHHHRLLDIDMLTVSRNDLRTLFSGEIREVVSVVRFDTALHGLLNIFVNMVDDGKETDIFFIHE